MWEVVVLEVVCLSTRRLLSGCSFKHYKRGGWRLAVKQGHGGEVERVVGNVQKMCLQIPQISDGCLRRARDKEEARPEWSPGG